MVKHKKKIIFSLLIIVLASLGSIVYKRIYADWTQQIIPAVSNWNDIVSSSDGTKLAASNYTDDFIYTSTDSGATWTKQLGSGPRYYRDLASSADGTNLVAVANNGYVYTSNDSGVTWIERTDSGIRSWRSVVTSSDGIVIVAGVFSGYSYMSSDGGETWTEQTSIGTKNWSDLALSSDDSTLVLASAQPNYIYTSNDYGNTWTERTGSGNRYFTVVDVSSDGSKIVAGVEAGYIYTSTDGGVTWTERTGAGAKYWASIASSADGSKIITSILDGGDYVYISSDGGATWEAQTAIGTITGRGATISDDGNKFFVLTNGSGIWRYINYAPTLTTTPATYTERSTTTLNGEITGTGGVNPTIRGFQYGLDTNYGTNTTESGSFSTGTYSSSIENLECNTTYHYRAYATNTVGTSYGSDTTFTTSSCPSTSGSYSKSSPYYLSLISPTVVTPSTPSTPTQTQPVSFTRTLKLINNDRIAGDDVIALQEFLNSKGYTIPKTTYQIANNLPSSDGVFGPKTKQALIQFQRDHNLVPDGVFGPKTKAKVEEVMGKVTQ